MVCRFDNGEYCEYLSEDLRPDEGLYHLCVVASHQFLCIYYEEAGPDQAASLLKQYTDERGLKSRIDKNGELVLMKDEEDFEPLILLDDDGEEVKE